MQDAVQFGEFLEVSFHRTLRVPETGTDYPLPPTFGRFPLAELSNVSGEREFALPIRKREALWIAFESPGWRPHAVKVGVGDVNAIDGGLWTTELRDDPQNYVITGTQYWLDGINAGEEFVRQFVATSFGLGVTIEEQVSRTREGTIRLAVFAPRPGFSPPAPPEEALEPDLVPADQPALGLGSGGRIQQKIHPDPYGLATWDLASQATARIRLLDPSSFTALTGRTAPPTPIDATSYSRLGLPWFHLYEEQDVDVPAADIFRNIKTISSLGGAEEPDIDALHVHLIRNPRQIL